MDVASILKTKGNAVATVTRDSSLQEVAGLLASRRIGAIVITSAEGAVEGIVSERDIVKAIANRGGACLAEAVANIMTKDVTTTEPRESIDHVMSLMTAGRFRHVPVVENGRLVGIVSIGDAVKHHMAEVELEASQLKNYVLAG
jgi:CBS domain-containing protein